MQIKDILTKTTLFFRGKGFESARLDTELLLSSALGWERMKLYLNYEYPLSEEELSKAREMVRRRAAGEPVAYILGKKDFYNHTFNVSSAVLIPRPETEQIVEEVSAWMKSSNANRVIDLGTGSGCIGLSILAEVTEAKLLAVDISSDAITVASSNAEKLEVADRVTFMTDDAGKLDSLKAKEVLGGLADAVVANPPYISESDPAIEANVKKFEPSGALFSPKNGLQHIEEWAVKTAELVKPGGLVMFEIGYEQGRAAQEIFERIGAYENIKIVKDMAGQDRFVKAMRLGE